mmetsp:Transcript_120934/g.349421  ORF Transcript_120934/g.349421 Transcript_120934/m.349421 type:complete len:234 (+) Transcript_120934:28-729(+)
MPQNEQYYARRTPRRLTTGTSPTPSRSQEAQGKCEVTRNMSWAPQTSENFAASAMLCAAVREGSSSHSGLRPSTTAATVAGGGSLNNAAAASRIARPRTDACNSVSPGLRPKHKPAAARSRADKACPNSGCCRTIAAKALAARIPTRGNGAQAACQRAPTSSHPPMYPSMCISLHRSITSTTSVRRSSEYSPMWAMSSGSKPALESRAAAWMMPCGFRPPCTTKCVQTDSMSR